MRPYKTGGHWAKARTPTDQVPMPAEQRLWLHEEPLPASTIKQPAQPGEQCSTRGLQHWSGHLTTKDGDLVAEHDDLDRQFFVVPPTQPQQPEDHDEGNIEK
jgi:hypothetical protein